MFLLQVWQPFNRTYMHSFERSLLEKIPIILLRQPSKLLLGLFDKQQSMIHVAVELYQGLVSLNLILY